MAPPVPSLPHLYFPLYVIMSAPTKKLEIEILQKNADFGIVLMGRARPIVDEDGGGSAGHRSRQGAPTPALQHQLGKGPICHQLWVSSLPPSIMARRVINR